MNSSLSPFPSSAGENPHTPQARILQDACGVLRTELAGLQAMIAALEAPPVPGSPGLGQAFIQAVERILHDNMRVVVTGIGKSGHIGRKIQATLASTGTPAIFVHPAEASHGDLLSLIHI